MGRDLSVGERGPSAAIIPKILFRQLPKVVALGYNLIPAEVLDRSPL